MSRERSTLVPLAAVVEDFHLYPRTRVDDVHVNDLLRHHQGGATLPPVILDRKSKRIIDGFHRVRVWRKALGAKGKIPAILRDYKDEAAMFLEAMQLNATHGRKLDHQDISHIIIKAKDNFGISLQTVALHLYLPPREIQRIDKDVCYVSSTGQAYPLKRGLEHLRGTTLSTEQIDAVRTVRTCEGGRLFLELTTMIKNRLVEWTPLNLERAKVLRDLLTNVLNQQTPKSKKKAS